MKSLVSIILLCVVVWGCGKQTDIKPTDPAKTDGNPSTPIKDTTKTQGKDDSVHMVTFVVYAQKVKTSVSGKKLSLAYDEDVNLFLTAEGYHKTSAIHLKEDFKQSALGAFDFRTENAEGQLTFNYVDDNLNNVKFKSITDTVVNGIKMVKINVHRLITFSKEYGVAQLAVDQQNLLLGKTGDMLTFSSFTYYNQKNYPAVSAVAYVQYIK
ncbi:hypothetical protein [Mucilaginibacter xinganensis]|uniref:Uncharacterized protein n=1 Tax=Mucilaginibacter xinganensis TaxID=1234841 RepID=A0A223P3W7_9SPHI|nr:hypothetical protein [Mucilaginibacter xinganensis]ASU36817.1 hypothetical protein MuYL_4934 [Mucilaginibacter xinganensis]